MSIMVLLIAILATCVVVWLVKQGSIPSPFVWVVYAVLIILWLFVVISLLGIADMTITPLRR